MVITSSSYINARVHTIYREASITLTAASKRSTTNAVMTPTVPGHAPLARLDTPLLAFFLAKEPPFGVVSLGYPGGDHAS